MEEKLIKLEKQIELLSKKIRRDMKDNWSVIKDVMDELELLKAAWKRSEDGKGD